MATQRSTPARTPDNTPDNTPLPGGGSWRWSAEQAGWVEAYPAPATPADVPAATPANAPATPVQTPKE